MLSNKITKIRKREKKSELSNFDRIATGNLNFKKKVEPTPYLVVEK